MLPHLLNLLNRSSLSFLALLGTTGLGWWVQGIIWFFVTEIATYIVVWRVRGKDEMKARAKENLTIGFYAWLIVMACIYIPIFAYNMVRIVYVEHMELVSRNVTLSKELERRRNHLLTSDPIFDNVNSLLLAFDMYRHARHGEPCVIWLSAPPGATTNISGEVAQFSNSVSDCFTFGPMTDGNPEYDEEAIDGMVPDAVVFHAAKDDKAAFQLFGNFSSLISSRLSYKLPPKIASHYQLPLGVAGKEHIIWLQFGTNTRWNSELQ